MRAFRYACDPLSLVALVAYALNRWLLKPHLAGGFMHDQFNDLLLIPAALPVVLWLQRKLGWRTHDGSPGWHEILVHLGIWTIICEGIGPLLLDRGTADWRDALAYGAGALCSGFYWSRARRSATPAIATA